MSTKSTPQRKLNQPTSNNAQRPKSQSSQTVAVRKANSNNGVVQTQSTTVSRTNSHNSNNNNNNNNNSNLKNRELETVKPPKQYTEEELEKMIEPEYFKEEFDSTQFFLEKLSVGPNEQEILEQINIKSQQLEIITTKLSSNVMSNYSSFVKGMTEIRELESEIQTTAQICRNGRSNLRRANFELISGPVNIIATHRKTLLYRQILQYLMKIKRVKEIQEELKQSLEARDYLRAVELCKESKKEVEIFRMFNCVKAIDFEVQNFYSTVKDKLSTSLLEVTRNFSPSSYERILAAYSLSDSAESVQKKLQTFFMDSVSSSSRDLLYAHVIMAPENVLNAESLKKKEFKDLCTYLRDEHFMQCLTTIFEYLCELMYSHHCMREWHIQQEMEGSKFSEFMDVRKGLEDCRSKIWKKMEKRVTRMIQTSSLATYKIDSFLEVLDAVNKLIEIGEEFSSTKANFLRECINQQSKSYFIHFHKKKAEDLKDVLDNEVWQSIPLDTINDIKEFRTFIQNTPLNIINLHSSSSNNLSNNNNNNNSNNSNNSSVNNGSNSSNNLASASNNNLLSNAGSLMNKKTLSSFFVNGNPFAKVKENKEANLSDDEDEELKQDFVDEGEVQSDNKFKITLPSRNKSPEKEEFNMLSMSSTNLLKQIGIYLQMMKTLHPIASDIFIGLTQLYNYFLFSILYFFAVKPKESSTSSTNTSTSVGSNINVSTLLSSVRDLRGTSNQTTEAEPATPRAFIDGISNPKLRALAITLHDSLFDHAIEINSQKKARFYPPTLSAQVSLTSAKRTFGISERIVGAESLIFLANSMNIIKPFIMNTIPENSAEFFRQSVDVASDVKREILNCLIPKFIPINDIPTTIEKVKWTTNDIGDNNVYINNLVKDFQKFDEKIKEFKKLGLINESSLSMFMECAICMSMDSLIEGFSRVKKCSDQGRVLMSLDCQVFQNALLKFTDIRPIPKAVLVDAYIKGFYTQPEELLNWLKTHSEEYSVKHLHALALSVLSNINNKKVRTDLGKEVDDYLLSLKK